MLAMSEIVFLVEDAAEGGVIARALVDKGVDATRISTRATDWKPYPAGVQ